MATTERLLQSVWSDEATTRTTYDPNSTVHLLQELLLASSDEAKYLASGPELATTF